MGPVDLWSSMSDLSSSQFGLFTAAQARRRDIPGYQLARYARTGRIVRVRHGVYAFAGNDSDHLQAWAAQWLALLPDADIEVRRAYPDCIVSHESAAVIRELGDFQSVPLCLTGPRAIRVKSNTVRTYRREIGPRGADWDLVDGLPVASPARIIADLARKGIHQAEQLAVIEGALSSGLVSRDEVTAQLGPFRSAVQCHW
ncbi:type IV toxin-antitoxin system AbiEi family antitoxin domain-containing protein [Mycolicibacterium sp. Y3]